MHIMQSLSGINCSEWVKMRFAWAVTHLATCASRAGLFRVILAGLFLALRYAFNLRCLPGGTLPSVYRACGGVAALG